MKLVTSSSLIGVQHGAGRFWSFLQESATEAAPLHAFAVRAPFGRLFDRVTQAPHVKRGASTSEETAKSRFAGDEVIAETVGLCSTGGEYRDFLGRGCPKGVR